MMLQLCAVVDSILAAFENGVDVSKRMLAPPRKQKKNMKNIEVNKDEFQLRDSLAKRPQEIRQEYEHSVVRHGQRFEAGDSQSHSSLARILLVMNSGLLEIINHALSGDAKARGMSQKSLLNLSEVAATDTLNAFAQLNDRLSTSPRITSAVVPYNQVKQARRGKSGPKTGSPVLAERPPPSPLLVRGGWVRSKSGSSVVSASEARREAARRDENKRSQSSPTAGPHVNAKAAMRLVEPKYEKNSDCLADAGPISRDARPGKISTAIIRKEPPPYTQFRPPSVLIVPADFFETFDIDAQRSAPPRPPKIPLHSRPNPISRQRPMSGATFMTASTKIGEIPEDKIPDRILSNEEQERIALPYVIPPLLLEQPKKKRRGFRLWKRQPVAAC